MWLGLFNAEQSFPLTVCAWFYNLTAHPYLSYSSFFGFRLSSVLVAMVIVIQTPPKDELLPLEGERLTVCAGTVEIFKVILTTW